MLSILEEEKNNDISKKKKKIKNSSEIEKALTLYTKEFREELSSIYNEIQNFDSKSSFFFLEKPYEKISLNEKQTNIENKFNNTCIKETNDYRSDYTKEDKKKKQGFGFDFQILNSKNLHYEKMSID